jgi:hypothetical protein
LLAFVFHIAHFQEARRNEEDARRQREQVS